MEIICSFQVPTHTPVEVVREVKDLIHFYLNFDLCISCVLEVLEVP